MKLNQIIALVSGKKTRIQKLLTAIHHNWEDDRLSGICRTYQPKDEDGDVFPPESRAVQVTVDKVLSEAFPYLEDFINIVASQEITNARATADIKIGEDTVLAEDIPVTVLLFLEKRLIDLRTLIEKIPILPLDKTWVYRANSGCFESEAEETTKTRKGVKVIVKYQATKEHPAQTELVKSDELIGRWKTVHYSGAAPKEKIEKMIRRVEALQEAVKIAREEANAIDAQMETDLGKALLSYIFNK